MLTFIVNYICSINSKMYVFNYSSIYPDVNEHGMSSVNTLVIEANDLNSAIEKVVAYAMNDNNEYSDSLQLLIIRLIYKKNIKDYFQSICVDNNKDFQFILKDLHNECKKITKGDFEIDSEVTQFFCLNQDKIIKLFYYHYKLDSEYLNFLEIDEMVK